MIYETIVTTLSPEGAVHIAPFGITEDEQGLAIAPFRPSVSLDNLEATGCAVINLTDDGRVLESALAHREVRVAAREDDETRPRFRLAVVHEETHAPFRGFNRAQAAVIEAAILVSRLHMLPAEKIESEIAYLDIAISKTAGVREREAWGWLMERIADYKANAAKAAG